MKLDRVKEAIGRVKHRIYIASQQGDDLRTLQEELQGLFDARKHIEKKAFLVDQ